MVPVIFLWGVTKTVLGESQTFLYVGNLELISVKGNSFILKLISVRLQF